MSGLEFAGSEEKESDVVFNLNLNIPDDHCVVQVFAKNYNPMHLIGGHDHDSPIGHNPASWEQSRRLFKWAQDGGSKNEYRKIIGAVPFQKAKQRAIRDAIIDCLEDDRVVHDNLVFLCDAFQGMIGDIILHVVSPPHVNRLTWSPTRLQIQRIFAEFRNDKERKRIRETLRNLVEHETAWWSKKSSLALETSMGRARSILDHEGAPLNGPLVKSAGKTG